MEGFESLGQLIMVVAQLRATLFNRLLLVMTEYYVCAKILNLLCFFCYIKMCFLVPKIDCKYYLAEKPYILFYAGSPV